MTKTQMLVAHQTKYHHQKRGQFGGQFRGQNEIQKRDQKTSNFVRDENFLRVFCAIIGSFFVNFL